MTCLHTVLQKCVLNQLPISDSVEKGSLQHGGASSAVATAASLDESDRLEEARPGGGGGQPGGGEDGGRGEG